MVSLKNSEFVKLVVDTLRKEKGVKILGIGTFRLKMTKPRIGRNPRTGAEIQIPAHEKVSFKPSSTLKNEVL